ncbi:hypothetical protein ACFQVC_10965 [Streptomyces monticola]|uniref:Uncharacterized protein n=1 Tax=Streptomyces monticola TaxID=2666263 RepID=A0ABW2JG15_9ACTN
MNGPTTAADSRSSPTAPRPGQVRRQDDRQAACRFRLRVVGQADDLKGKYIKASVDNPDLKGFTALCNLDNLQKETGTGSVTGLSKGGETSVDDTDAIAVSGSADGVQYTADVATEGKPYPLKVVAKGAEKDTSLVFSDYDEPVKVTPPPANETIAW